MPLAGCHEALRRWGPCIRPADVDTDTQNKDSDARESTHDHTTRMPSREHAMHINRLSNTHNTHHQHAKDDEHVYTDHLSLQHITEIIHGNLNHDGATNTVLSC